MSGNKIPHHVWESAKVNENVDKGKCIIQWTLYGQTFTPIYQLLQMMFFKCWPFQAAMLLKNKSFQWSIRNWILLHLDLGKPLNSIMLIKMNSPEDLLSCQKMKCSEALRWKCKSACMHCNKEHSNLSWFPQMSFVFNC